MPELSRTQLPITDRTFLKENMVQMSLHQPGLPRDSPASRSPGLVLGLSPLAWNSLLAPLLTWRMPLRHQLKQAPTGAMSSPPSVQPQLCESSHLPRLPPLLEVSAPQRQGQAVCCLPFPQPGTQLSGQQAATCGLPTLAAPVLSESSCSQSLGGRKWTHTASSDRIQRCSGLWPALHPQAGNACDTESRLERLSRVRLCRVGSAPPR